MKLPKGYFSSYFIRAWVEEKNIVAYPYALTKSSDIYDAFMRWFNEKHPDKRCPISKTLLTREIISHFNCDTTRSNGRTILVGVELVERNYADKSEFSK